MKNPKFFLKILLFAIPLIFIGCGHVDEKDDTIQTNIVTPTSETAGANPSRSTQIVFDDTSGLSALTSDQKQKLIAELNLRIKNLRKPKVGKVYWADNKMNWFKTGDSYKIISVLDVKDNREISAMVNNIQCSKDKPEEIKKHSFFHYELLARQGKINKHIYLKSEFSLKCSQLIHSDKNISSIIEVKHGKYFSLVKFSKFKYAGYSDFEEFSEELVYKDPLRKWRNNSRLLKAVRNNSIYLGMPENALYVSWGKPDTTSQSVHSGNIHKQLIYRNSYVYLEKGVVARWKD